MAHGAHDHPQGALADEADGSLEKGDGHDRAEGNNEASEDKPGEDVPGVVGPHVDAGEGERQGDDRSQGGQQAVTAHPQSHGHGPGHGGVIARKGEVVGTRYQHLDVAEHRIGTSAAHQVGEGLVEAKGH